MSAVPNDSGEKTANDPVSLVDDQKSEEKENREEESSPSPTNVKNLFEPPQEEEVKISNRLGSYVNNDKDHHAGLSESPEGQKLNPQKKSESFGSKLKIDEKDQTFFASVANKEFILFAFVIPCCLVAWYAIAILFPPEARNVGFGKYYLWDDGALTVNDKHQYTICPRSSICSEGAFQLLMIASARLTAFVSYVFMTFTFVSKMHFFARFLASTYMRKYIPFPALHHLHSRVAKIYGGLIFVHVLTHYLRYIARKDVQQLGSAVHLSGFFATMAIIVMIFGMASKKVKQLKFLTFEKRFNLHWIGIAVLFWALCYHHPRTRIVTIVVLGLWFLDYLYGVFFSTYNLEVVELLPSPKNSGVQMLWRNPEGFNPKSGEYIKIQLPWLSQGGDEWHPFSVYLRESTEKGFFSVHNNRGQNITCPNVAGLSESESKPSIHSRFIEEAREDITKKYQTTQIFISPNGDWTKRLMQELANQKQLRACWVRGPYKSPYSVAQDFSHLVLLASGIGITPALGVLGQYPGFSRTKILIWTTRDPALLKFFIPLIKDNHLSVIYYTGPKKELSEKEVLELSSYGNIYIQKSRPESLKKTIEKIVIKFENKLHNNSVAEIRDLNIIYRKAWCLFYCGGSKAIKDDLKAFSKYNGVNFESELFNW